VDLFFAAEAAHLRLQARQHIEDGGLAGASVADQTYFHSLYVS
jgi:hypothetical protein